MAQWSKVLRCLPQLDLVRLVSAPGLTAYRDGITSYGSLARSRVILTRAERTNEKIL